MKRSLRGERSSSSKGRLQGVVRDYTVPGAVNHSSEEFDLEALRCVAQQLHLESDSSLISLEIRVLYILVSLHAIWAAHGACSSYFAPRI